MEQGIQWSNVDQVGFSNWFLALGLVANLDIWTIRFIKSQILKIVNTITVLAPVGHGYMPERQWISIWNAI